MKMFVYLHTNIYAYTLHAHVHITQTSGLLIAPTKHTHTYTYIQIWERLERINNNYKKGAMHCALLHGKSEQREKMKRKNSSLGWEYLGSLLLSNLPI